MGWVLACGLAIVCFAAIVLLKTPRPVWAAVATAVVLGLAGYALQAHPVLSGSPREGGEKLLGNEAAMVDARRAFSGGGQPLSDNHWIMVSDALARHGEYAEASDMLLGAVTKDPNSAEGWLALANALVGHAGGSLTPASAYAFRHAAAAAPDQPGPPYFLGLALAQTGRFGEARTLWAKLLAASPADAPWRPDLQSKLQRLDALIAMQQQAGASGH